MFVTTYSDRTENVTRVLNKHWDIIKSDPILWSKIGTHVSSTFRRAQNLRDSLKHSHFSKTEALTWLTPLEGFYKCGTWKSCQNSINRSEYLLPNGKHKMITKFITCTSIYCIYVIECECNLQYVGSTIFPLKNRS